MFLHALDETGDTLPTGEFRWWREISTYTLTFAAALAVLIVFWSARSELLNLQQYQSRLMGNEGRSVADDISRFVSERSRLLKLFAEQNADLLSKFVDEGGRGDIHRRVENLIRTHFPHYFAFTIRTDRGQLVPDDFGEFVGEVCRRDIQQFILQAPSHDAGDRVPYLPFIHPQAGKYHFDMMANWTMRTGEPATLFVSFDPVQLSQIIDGHELPGHRIVLVRNDQKDLVELTSQGSRDVLGENPRLAPADLERVYHTLPIENTRWTVLVMAQAWFMEGLEGTIYKRAGIQTLGIVLFWLGALWLMVRALRQRQQAYLTIHDQTERLLSSQQVAHVGSWDWNMETGNLAWTDEIYSIFGRSRDDFSSTYEHFLECIHPDDREKVVEAVNAAVNDNVPYDIEHRVLLPDGSVSYVHEQGKVYRNASGKPVRMLGVVLDITTRALLDISKSEFIATVSHELRTPLTSINGSLGLIFGGAVGELPDKAQEMIGVAHRNAERLIALVNDLLDLEKLQSGKMEFHFEKLDLGAVVKEAFQANVGFAQKNQVKLHVATDLPEAIVMLDKARIIQVVTNLVSNAVKFSNQGDVVEVSLTRRGNVATVQVTDSGPGVPENHRERIFERFTQVDASDQRAKSGTGLGLSICKSIIDEHGGTIGVQSMLGQGSTFRFSLPLAEE